MTVPTPPPSDLPAQIAARLQGLGARADAAQVVRLSKALGRLAPTQPLDIDPACRDFVAVLQRCRHG